MYCAFVSGATQTFTLIYTTFVSYVLTGSVNIADLFAYSMQQSPS
jgi:uncharacterized membrane protein